MRLTKRTRDFEVRIFSELRSRGLNCLRFSTSARHLDAFPKGTPIPMYFALIHRRTRSRFLVRLAASPLALTLGVLPFGTRAVRADAASDTSSTASTSSSRTSTPTRTTAPVGKPRVLLAQLRQGDHNAPAATPSDQPRVLQLPTGPTIGPPSTAPTTDAQNNSTVLSPGGAGTNTETSEPTIIGPVTESEGREIAEVRVVGNRIVTSEAVLSQVRTQRGAAFSSRLVDLDRTRINALGFFATVQAQVAPDINDPLKVVVTYIVVENRVVTGARFVGNTVVKSEDLQKALTSKVGVVLNSSTVVSDVKAIEDTYKSKGFAVLVQSATQEENGRILFTLLEARVTAIKLLGLTKTRPTLVRRLIRTPIGLPFDNTNISRDVSRLNDTGFFEAIAPDTIDDPDTRGGIIITYRFKERRSGNFNVGLGFDSRSKISGSVSVGENNLNGSGKRAAVSVEAGSQRNYELNYANPFVGPRLGSYDVSIFTRTLYREPRIFQNLVGSANANTVFAERRTGARLNFAQPLDQERNNTFLFGYRNERGRLQTSNFTSIGGVTTPTTINIPGFTDSSTVSAASVGFLRDKRDSRLEPSRGQREQLTLEQGFKLLGGSTNFTKLDIDLRRYLPLSKPKNVLDPPKIVLAGRVVLGRSLNQLPAFEQYFIGGPDTVRGYNNDYQFGDNQFFANAELRYRLNRQIQGVLFSDAGSSFGGQFTSNKNVDLLTSVGVGLRLQTPIGPVRLDLGFGRNGSKTHFAIGSTF